MKLIGMLDSPYVRRVAITLQLLGLDFEHEPLSVFRTFDEFRAINPVVKAPTLVCDDGTVLMDSTLLIDYAESLAGRSLMPSGPAERRQALRVLGLALAACEKTVQIVYEHNLRPVAHAPWLERVEGQMRAAYRELEAEFERHPRPASRGGIDQAGLSAAVAWNFTALILPGQLAAAEHPRLAAYSALAEALPEFAAAPYGPGSFRRAG